MKTIKIKENAIIFYQNDKYKIIKLLTLSCFLAENILTKELKKIFVHEITPEPQFEDLNNSPQIDSISEKDWKIAEYRFSIIKPILEDGGGSNFVNEIAKTNNINRATIYRWISDYQSTGTISSLAPKIRSGGKGKSRLNDIVEKLVKSVIEESYLTPQKKTLTKVYQEIKLRCKNAQLEAPTLQTVRNRIIQIPNFELFKGRYGTRIAKEKFSPIKGHFPNASFPLSVIQIDHTLLDIILVDKQHRLNVGRPWITLAIDVYSRMIVGFYISFDPPGELGTGACIANAILTKEKILSKYDLTEEWPCWGVMKNIHLDNAREFRGNMLKRACKEYNIDISFRPVATPHWGGHIERLVGTIVREIHALPGTTFSKKSERVNYNSENKASMTLEELEKWLLIFITEIYHKRIHNGINTTPLSKYMEGIVGSNEIPGIGIPERIIDEKKVRLDFLPFKERTIQEYGVIIGSLYYYHDILRRWINSKDPSIPKLKRKFIFKMDPRDISILYFFDPEIKDYYPIPLRDTSKPPISIWEYRSVIKKLKDDGKKRVNEEEIFRAYEKLKSIEKESISSTKKSRHRRKSPKSIDRESIHKKIIEPETLNKFKSTFETLDDITPFEDIDDEIFK